jgi:hypothetical protein
MCARRLLRVKLPEDELTQIVTEAVKIEREFVTDALPVNPCFPFLQSVSQLHLHAPPSRKARQHVSLTI